MTYPRAHLVDAVNGGTYHCISRCVRRAWLCGFDALTGRDFEHRRHWIEQRILALGTLFAVDLFAYAVMDNHYHVVVRTEPRQTHTWPDEDVARRWILATRGQDDCTEERIRDLLLLPGRLAVLRERLGDLSWFMRLINEPLARMANIEDGVTGRFWEGRFRSIALLDDAAVLACMAYVDLNPIRAGQIDQPGRAQYTSMACRAAQQDAVSGLCPVSALGLSLERYLELVQWTVGSPEGRTRAPPNGVTATLSAFGYETHRWRGRVDAHRHRFRAYGALRRLVDYAARLGQHWVRGAQPGLAAP